VKPDFPQYLSDLITKRYASRREFIRAAYPKSAENSANSYLSQVINGLRPPPPDHLARWADALGLRGASREEFFVRAVVLHLPEGLRTIVTELHAEVVKLRKSS
jgi:hypothetical protein